MYAPGRAIPPPRRISVPGKMGARGPGRGRRTLTLGTLRGEGSNVHLSCPGERYCVRRIHHVTMVRGRSSWPWRLLMGNLAWKLPRVQCKECLAHRQRTHDRPAAAAAPCATSQAVRGFVPTSTTGIKSYDPGRPALNSIRVLCCTQSTGTRSNRWPIAQCRSLWPRRRPKATAPRPAHNAAATAPSTHGRPAVVGPAPPWVATIECTIGGGHARSIGSS